MGGSVKQIPTVHGPSFFQWFLTHKAMEVKESMLRSLRENTGLGSPPCHFYTNICECLNSILHEKVQYKTSEWPKFNESMQEIVELAVIKQQGEFNFKPQYKHLIISFE